MGLGSSVDLLFVSLLWFGSVGLGGVEVEVGVGHGLGWFVGRLGWLCRLRWLCVVDWFGWLAFDWPVGCCFFVRVACSSCVFLARIGILLVYAPAHASAAVFIPPSSSFPF